MCLCVCLCHSVNRLVEISSLNLRREAISCGSSDLVHPWSWRSWTTPPHQFPCQRCSEHQQYFKLKLTKHFDYSPKGPKQLTSPNNLYTQTPNVTSLPPTPAQHSSSLTYPTQPSPPLKPQDSYSSSSSSLPHLPQTAPNSQKSLSSLLFHNLPWQFHPLTI